MTFVTTPLVSVIIPTRDRMSLLREAVGSVFTQEARDEMFRLEVIVIDDASSDNTSNVLLHFPEIRYLRLDTNGGPAAARNAGIAVSTGQYVAFLDDDDVWLPNRLRVQIPILERHGDIGVVYGQGWVKNLNGILVLWPNLVLPVWSLKSS